MQYWFIWSSQQANEETEKITLIRTLLFASDRNLAPKEFQHKRKVGDLGVQKEWGPMQAQLNPVTQITLLGLCSYFLPDFLPVAENLTSSRLPPGHTGLGPSRTVFLLPNVHIWNPRTTYREVSWKKWEQLESDYNGQAWDHVAPVRMQGMEVLKNSWMCLNTFVRFLLEYI